MSSFLLVLSRSGSPVAIDSARRAASLVQPTHLPVAQSCRARQADAARRQSGRGQESSGVGRRGAHHPRWRVAGRKPCTAWQRRDGTWLVIADTFVGEYPAAQLELKGRDTFIRAPSGRQRTARNGDARMPAADFGKPVAARPSPCGRLVNQRSMISVRRSRHVLEDAPAGSARRPSCPRRAARHAYHPARWRRAPAGHTSR